MKNYLITSWLALSLFGLTQCTSKEFERQRTLFSSDPANNIILSVDGDIFCTIIGADCSPNAKMGFRYEISKDGQIYLFDNDRLYVTKDGILVNTIDISKYAEKLMGKRTGVKITAVTDSDFTGSDFIDPNENAIYIELSAFENTQSNFVYVKYEINNGRTTELKTEGKHAKYRFNSYFYALSGKTSNQEELNLEKLPEGTSLIEVIDDYVYYLDYGDAEADILPSITKANNELDFISSVEISTPYNQMSSKTVNEDAIMWQMVTITNSDDIHISFFNPQTNIWYIQKFAFESVTEEVESFSNDE